MKVYDYRCAKCEHKEIDKLVDKFDEVVECPKCTEPMTRLFNSIGRINVRGIDYKGDGSRVDRFEFVSKGVETVDSKASQKEGRIVLKDSK